MKSKPTKKCWKCNKQYISSSLSGLCQDCENSDVRTEGGFDSTAVGEFCDGCKDKLSLQRNYVSGKTLCSRCFTANLLKPIVVENCPNCGFKL